MQKINEQYNIENEIYKQKAYKAKCVKYDGKSGGKDGKRTHLLPF